MGNKQIEKLEEKIAKMKKKEEIQKQLRELEKGKKIEKKKAKKKVSTDPVATAKVYFFTTFYWCCFLGTLAVMVLLLEIVLKAFLSIYNSFYAFSIYIKML